MCSRKGLRFCHDLVKKHIRPHDKDLASQIDKALISIVLNIAEGSADLSDVEFARFLGISLRSHTKWSQALTLACSTDW
ncbi:MAG TPA: four helix bundle protein [Thermodesulfobacteriota bacterium]|nr:four helix bundle protein [Thermodesulfobacteriota bacterium]